jgi:hypoxia up-regulated 1
MNPLGRRRFGAASPLVMLLALFVLFNSTANAAASVLGIDFGTQNIKAALVKPGIPLEIVLTKDSKRKEAAAVAFKPTRDADNNIVAEKGKYPERAYGGDALALQGRMPGEVFPNLKSILGVPWSGGSHPAVEEYKSRYPAVKAQQDKQLGSTLFSSDAFAKPEVGWTVEELLAMEFANIKRNAEAMAGKGTTVEDVVITIPAFYTADERRAIKRAAHWADLWPNALPSDGLAVGLDYAKSRTFPDVSKGERPEHHLVFDMGAGSTTATVLRFQSRSVKDVGRFNKTVQEVAVLGAGWDRTLGGDSLNQVIVDDYVNKFLTKPVMKSRGMSAADIKSNGRVMSRLWKEAEKARQVLSANSETSSSFEELLPEIDFRTKLTRAEYEELAASFVQRVEGPVKDALAAAKMTMEDVDSIILHGGVVRTPFVQRKLEELAGSPAKLRSNVNADEAAVFGAAFKGAGLSPSFKVREIRDSDIASYPSGMIYNDEGKERRQILFSATSAVGHGAATKQVTFKDKEDFEFTLYQVVDGQERPIATYPTKNLTDSVKALKDRFGCEKEDVVTKFSMKLSDVDGLPEAIYGTVSCEVDDAKGGSVGDTVKDWLGFGGKKDQEPLKEGEEGEGPTEQVDAATSSAPDAETATSSSVSTSSSKAAEKPKKRTEVIPLAYHIELHGNKVPEPPEILRIRERLDAFDRSDKTRVAREEALNSLESYTYFVRDFLENEDYIAVSTQAERDELSKSLDEVRSFMENVKEVAKATESKFKWRLNGLKDLVQPIQQRRNEVLARPEKIEELKKSLEKTEKLVDMVRKQLAQAAEARSKAEELASSSTTASPSASAGADDEWADLEEPDTTTAADIPKYSSPADFSLYSDVDLKELEASYEAALTWLKEKEAEQSRLLPTDQPVLLVKDIEAQAEKLGKVVTDLVYKKMQQAKPKGGAKKAKSSSSSSSKSKGAKKTKSLTAAAEEPTKGSEEEYFDHEL